MTTSFEYTARDPLGKFSGGDPELSVLGEVGDVPLEVLTDVDQQRSLTGVEAILELPRRNLGNGLLRCVHGV